MTNHRWYFLVRKDGETKWHSLTTSSSLPAGRYQLAAKSDRCNLDVDIRLVHTPLNAEKSEKSEKKDDFLTQRSCHRLNSQGFMLLSPLRDFEPGVWQIRCLPTVLAEMSGASWQASLKFTITANVEVLSDHFQPTKVISNETIDSAEKIAINNSVMATISEKMENKASSFKSLINDDSEQIENNTPTVNNEDIIINALDHTEDIGDSKHIVNPSEQDKVLENINQIKPPLTLEMPDVFTIPEFSLTPHKSIDLDDEQVTPELELIAHGHFQTDLTFTTPKLISDELTGTIQTTTKEPLSPSAQSEHGQAEIIAEVQSSETQVLAEQTSTEKNEETHLDLENSQQTDFATDLTPVDNLDQMESDRPLENDLLQQEISANNQREVNYIIQLHDLNSHTSVTVDIAFVQDVDQAPLDLRLPEPKIRKRLQFSSLSKSGILPPKLNSNRHYKSEKALQFTKFEPKENVS